MGRFNCSSPAIPGNELRDVDDGMIGLDKGCLSGYLKDIQTKEMPS